METFKLIAGGMDKDDVNVGGVNCVKHPAICKEIGVKAYPTVVLINRKHGMVQHYKRLTNGDVASQVKHATDWARSIAREWRFLFSYGQVEKISASSFNENGTVGNSTDAWVVMFTDGLDCGPCKTAKTNLMRLAASMRGLPVQV